MKVAIFTYKDLKELLNKPSEDATRKWVDSRGLKRRNRENSNVKEVLVPYEMYQKVWEYAGRPPEFSNPPVEEYIEENKVHNIEGENVINAEFSTYSPEDSVEENPRNSYALSTEFAEEFIKELAARQNALMDKNDQLYCRISDLSRYEERAKILELEIRKKEELLENYQSKVETLSDKVKEAEIIKVKMEYIQETTRTKEAEIAELKGKVDQLNENNRELESQLSVEKNKFSWLTKWIGI